MDERSIEQMRAVWRQHSTPVIFRRGSPHQLMVKLPFHVNNRAWLRISGRRHPQWLPSKSAFEVPQSWFNDLVRRCADRYGKVYIIQPHNKQQKCARRCWEAVGEECECSCAGENHGTQSSGAGWKEISDTFATKWEGRELACRLISRRVDPAANR